ncbi:hypothetical protein EVAR_95349_1 [Eumeta japonica]|uniref:Uncharacterized protein n=1 Tax=Eumeta variegata TaxID=151549 RepID=A0A4C1U9E9_EUMVA|nr:hypothetical protein EVAR_95349_1 [Eumeta japonica]
MIVTGCHICECIATLSFQVKFIRLYVRRHIFGRCATDTKVHSVASDVALAESAADRRVRTGEKGRRGTVATTNMCRRVYVELTGAQTSKSKKKKKRSTSSVNPLAGGKKAKTRAAGMWAGRPSARRSWETISVLQSDLPARSSALGARTVRARDEANFYGKIF